MTGAQIIREARLRAGLTQSGLAERLGCGRAQVARWETGRQQATFENLRAAVESCGFALKVEIDRQEERPAFDSELEASRISVPQQRMRALLEGRARDGSRTPEEFDPYAMFDALERHAVGYVVIGGVARVIHGSGESTCGLDIAPSLLNKNLHDLAAALLELGADLASLEALTKSLEALTNLPLTEFSRFDLKAGWLAVVPAPWGTQGYKDLRIRASRVSLGRGFHPLVASRVDLVRTLEASERPADAEHLRRLRRMMELDHPRHPHRRNKLPAR